LFGIDIVHAVEFSRIGCSWEFVSRLASRATSLTYHQIGARQNEYLFWQKLNLTKQTMQSARLFTAESYDWLHLSRRPKQVSPNYGQRVETLRDYNDEVKSIWLFLLSFFV
jgi:hypothetical protein